MQDNYNTCIVKMEQFQKFEHYGNTMSGNMVDRGSSIKLIKLYKYDYSIYSYNTLICFVDFKEKTYCINPTKYSTTTSKQVSYIRKAAKAWERKGFERILWI